MKQHETWLQHLSSCLELARTIVFALAGFSLAAIYIAVFGSAAQRAELAEARDVREILIDTTIEHINCRESRGVGFVGGNRRHPDVDLARASGHFGLDRVAETLRDDPRFC